MHLPGRWGSYTCEVRNNLGLVITTSFPLKVDNVVGHGTQTQITVGHGIGRTKIELRGWYKGENGTGEWIIEPNRTVNHRFSRPDIGP